VAETSSHRPMKVFLSSTLVDLEDHRAAVIRELRKNAERYSLVTMEDFTSEPTWPKDKCLDGVAGCDVFVGVLAWRYGAIPESETLSFTELEYRKAVEDDKRILMFLAGEQFPMQHIDRGAESAKIDAFRKHVEERHLVDRERFATPDQLAKLVVTALGRESWPPQVEKIAPAESTSDTLGGYLRWVIRMHQDLSLVALRPGTTVPVKLEEVYVALRGDRISAYELVESQRLLEEDVTALNEEFDRLPDHERRRLRACLLRESPHMQSLEERDRLARTDAGAIQSQLATITLAEAFRRERWLVILGDPGSGKTTLGRWLALNLARTLLDAIDSGRPLSHNVPVEVPAFQVNPETPYDRRMISLGPARLPILVRVSEYAEELIRSTSKGEPLALVDWLCKATWYQQPPSDGNRIAPAMLDRIFRDALNSGRAVLILDGLDEITEKANRRDVVEAIKEFCRDWVPSKPDLPSRGRPRTRAPYVAGPPNERGGNQIVVTSRIAGYHSEPLAIKGITTVTIEPMRRSAVEHFCDTWMRAVHAELYGEKPGIEETARQAADSLKTAIFAPSRASLAEIATNPLLITNIAALFLSRGETLPRTRAELFQLVIEMLISHWRQTGLNPDEVLYVLAPVAAEIHEKYATGLVEEADLTKLVTGYLAKYHGLSTDPLPPRIESTVRVFIQSLKEQVGLIAARGERLFGFLHLTFQEYLAGRHLVGNPKTAAANILSRIGDPRWREPILLAIGYIGWKWSASDRSALLSELLAADDPLGDFLPRIALLLAEGITEVPDLPEAAFRPLVRRLLGSYASPSMQREFPILRDRIENAFLRLRRFGDADWMDEVLAETITSPDVPDLAPAAARLIRTHGWFTPRNVEALREGLVNDSAMWEWPIEQSLRDLVSPAVEEPAPRVAPVDIGVREALQQLHDLETGTLLERERAALETMVIQAVAYQAELAELEPDSERAIAIRRWLFPYESKKRLVQELEGDPEAARQRLTDAVVAARESLESFAFTDSRDYERTLTRYAIAAASKERFDLRRSLQVRADLRSDDLVVRNLLEREQAIERLDVVQRAAVIAVYGGYPNCRADRTYDEYADLAGFISRAEAEREAILDANPDPYVGRFGNHDVIYDIAVYLDEGLMGRTRIARTPATFTPSAIYRGSALDPLFMQWLQRPSSVEVWTAELWQAWHTTPSARGKADAIAALVALGEDVVPEIEAALSNAATRPFAEAALANLARISGFLPEAVYRAREVVLDDLKSLGETEPATWTDIAHTALVEISRSSRTPVDFSDLRASAPADYRPVLEANRWFAAFGAIEDRDSAIGQVLDNVPDGASLISLTAAAHRAPLRLGGRLTFHWEVDSIPPRPMDGPTDIPIETIAALDSLHLEDIRFDLQFALQSVVVRQFMILTVKERELCPLVAAFAMKNGEFESAAELVPEIGSRLGDPFARILAAARRLENPYFAARAMAEVAPFFDRDERRAILDETLSAADRITDAFRRARVLEMALPVAAEEQRDDLLARAEAAARAVTDPDQRGRILARLTRHSSTAAALRFWTSAIGSIAEIPDEDQRAETLELIGMALPADPSIRAHWQHVCAAIESPQARSRATSTRGQFLLRTPPSVLTPKLAEHPDAWSLLLLSAVVNETLSRLRAEQSIRAVWRSIADGRTGDEVLTVLLRSQSEQGLALTADAARAIDILAATDQTETLEMLLPLLQSPAHDALPYVERWRRHPNELLARHANLLVAENGRRIDSNTLPALVACVSHGPDRSRCRAELVILSAVYGLAKDEPCLSVAELGIGICDELARIAIAHDDSDIRVSRVCHSVTADYVHDDPVVLQTWIDRARATDCADETATSNLQMILRLTDTTWPIFLQGLVDGPKSLRLVLLESLAGQFTIPGRVTRTTEVLDVLRKLDLDALSDVMILLGPEDYIAGTVVEVAKGDPERRDVTRLADDALRAAAVPLSDILRWDDQKLTATLSGIGATLFRNLDGSEPESQFGAELILENDTAFPLLIEWLTSTAERGEMPSIWYQKQKALLTVAARVVRRLPSVFAKHADPVRLEQSLARIAGFARNANSRRAAITLLSYLRRVTRRTVDALLSALQDDRHVQEAAFDALQRLRLTAEMRAPLTRTLRSNSTVVATGAARMLSVIARQERTPPDVRQEILNALIEVVRQRKSWNAIYRFTGTGGHSGDPVRITRLGSFEQELHRAVLDVAGLS
jgi:Domain of unknown function (DUF4062)